MSDQSSNLQREATEYLDAMSVQLESLQPGESLLAGWTVQAVGENHMGPPNVSPLHVVATYPLSWRDQLSEREQKEIALAQTYVADFNHGTNGHIAYCLLARLARMLDEA